MPTNDEYERGFMDAAAIVETERDRWRKSGDVFKDQRADAIQWCYRKMSEALAARQRQ